MSHHLHLLSLAYGITSGLSRAGAIDAAVWRVVPKRVLFAENRPRRLATAIASVYANEIRAEFARMMGDKP